MQETVSSEKLKDENDNRIQSNHITGPLPGKVMDSAGDSGAEVEPVITQEEFSTLEKTENKKKLFGFLKSMGKARDQQKDDSFSANDNGAEKKLSDMLLKIEKLEGKFEMLESSRSEHSDRMSNISEEIGELRSMIFSREETLGGIESEFRAIKEATAQIRPEKIAKDLESYSKDIMKAQAQAELEKSKVERLENELQKITDILDKIKSYENILDAAKDIKKQVDKINDSEKYTTRMAAKAEKIFGELDTRLLEFQKYKKEIEDTSEMIKDTVKSVDGLEIKLESLMPKDSFSKVKEETDAKIRDVDTRLKRLKDIVAELIERTYSNRGGSTSDIEAIKSAMQGEIAAGLSKQDAAYLSLKAGFDEKSEELEELERKFREISGAVLSLENNARYVKESIRDSKASVRERVPSVEAKVDDAAKQLKKETIRHISELDQKFRDISSSVENIEDKMGYIKECMDHESSAGLGIRPTIGVGILGSPRAPDAIHSEAGLKIIPKTSVPEKSPSLAGSFGSSSSSGYLQIASDFAAAEKICGSLRNHLEVEKSSKSCVKTRPKEYAPLPEIESSMSCSGPGIDMAGEIMQIKTVLDGMQKKIDSDKAGGLDISERQMLVDNASLHLGMAELDILDGDGSASRQKIEKVKALLEK